uniref:NFD4 C-terminal domain-containing protein n=1 Tax=Kalanchoe fedtschenkoi TaxID=63787 RepID=A0A7N0SYV7_KALFE
MIALTLILACVGHLLIAFNIPNGLYAASIIIGFCSGAQWPLMYAVISELFGLKYYSTLYNFGTMASPVGSYILNVRTVGYLYDKEARKQIAAAGQAHKADESLNCTGGQSYKVAFIIIGLAAALGALMWAVLVVRTRKFYSSDVYKKFREEGKTDGESEVAKNQSEVGDLRVPRN